MNDKAINAFIARKIRIDELIAKLQEASEDHFDVTPDEINWSHVGMLSDVAQDLERACNLLFADA